MSNFEEIYVPSCYGDSSKVRRTPNRCVKCFLPFLLATGITSTVLQVVPNEAEFD
jgi:hypothetical protein